MRARTNVLEPAPPRAGGENGGRGGWAWLVTANDIFEGQLLQGLLENAGVPVVTDGFDRGPFAWMYPSGNVRRPVQLFVPVGLLDTARLELLESSFVDAERFPAGDAVAGGSDAEHPLLRDRIRPTWLIVAILASMVVGGFVLLEILNVAPCERVFCIGPERNAPAHCDRPVAREQGGPVCVPNP